MCNDGCSRAVTLETINDSIAFTMLFHFFYFYNEMESMSHQIHALHCLESFIFFVAS